MKIAYIDHRKAAKAMFGLGDAPVCFKVGAYSLDTMRPVMIRKAMRAVSGPPVQRKTLQYSFERTARSIGWFAIALPCLAVLAWLIPIIPPHNLHDSLSHFYYVPIMGDVFVGVLVFLGILITFFFHTRDNRIRGWDHVTRTETYALRLAGLCAFGIALFPTPDDAPISDFLSGETSRGFFSTGAACTGPDYVCPIHDIPGLIEPLGIPLHAWSAATMFAILAYFTLRVFTRTQRAQSVIRTTQGTQLKPSKIRRNRAYRRLGAAIVISIVAIGIGFLLPDSSTGWDDVNATFWFEALALVSFGTAWLIKAGAVGWLND